ncbi:MAG: Threonine dehydrogenase and related Zn-dependent dehydrogenases, partial [uncultured Quadrisphaera sp.]
ESTHLAGQAERLRRGGARPGHPGTDRRHRQDHLDGDLRLRPAPVRGARPVHRPGLGAGPRADGRRAGGRLRRHAHQARRPRRRPVQHLLRPLLHVLEAALRPVRDHAGPRARQGRLPVRLHQALRERARRSGGVPAGAPGAVRADQDRGRPPRRALPLPLRRRLHRLAGRPLRRHPARGHPRRPRARADRAGRRLDRQAPRRRAGDRRRPRAREAAGSGRARRGGRRHARHRPHAGAARADRRPRRRCRVRGRGHGGPRRRPGQAGPAGGGPAARRGREALHRRRGGRPDGGAGDGVQGLPARRHRLDQRRLRRGEEPHPVDGDLRPRPAAADGPVPRAPVDRRDGAGADGRRRPAGRRRPGHPPPAPGAGAARLRHLPEEGGRLHQGGPPAL